MDTMEHITPPGLGLATATSVKDTKDGKIKKSRNRVPTSCSVCRRRKMKCDRAKPHCGSCLANNTLDICLYNQQPWEYLSTEKQLSNEVLRLKLRIAELEKALNQQQIISPPDSLSTGQGSNGENDDQLIDLGVRFDQLVIKQNRLVHYGTTSYMGLQTNDPVLLDMYRKFFKMHLEKYYDTLKGKPKEDNVIEERKETSNDTFCWSEKPNMAGASLQPESSNISQADLIDPINKILPSHEMVTCLIQHFFDVGYPLFPYVDENMFKAEMGNILFKGENGELYFSVTETSQITGVALLLILMRLSYLLLPMTDYYIDQERITNMNTLNLCCNEIAISPVFVEHAKACMSNAPGPENMMKKITLLNIQVLLFLKLYKMYAPEDADEASDSVITLAMVIQMCRIQGVYRDPELFQDVISNYSVRHLWRKIWYKLLLLDAYHAMQQGSPLIINDDQWDCRLPTLNDMDRSYLSNFSSPQNRKNNLLFDPIKYDKLFGEQTVCQAFELEYKTTVLVRQVVLLSHSMKVMPKKSDFVKMVKLTEGLGNLVPESFKELFSAPENKNHHLHTLNIRKFEMKCLIILVRYILSYVLLISSEDEEELNDNFNNLYGADSEYLVKTTESSLKLFKVGFEFLSFETEDEISANDPKLYAAHKNFFAPYDKLLASAILLGCQRSLQFLSSITLRYGINFFSFTSLIKNFDNSQDSVDVLSWFNISVHNLTTNVDVSLDKKFSIMLYRYIKVFYTKCSLLKDKIFHCLRLSVLIKLFINHLKLNFPDSYAELNEKYLFNKEEKNDEDLMNTNEDGELPGLIESEAHWFSAIQEDPRLSSYSLVDQQFLEIYSRETREQRLDNMDNMFSPSFLLSNNILSPLAQINEMMPTFKPDNEEN